MTATASTGEDGGSVTYTVTLSSATGLPVTGHNGVSFTLANGETVTIAAGALSGTVSTPINRDDVFKESDVISNAIVAKSGDTEFEKLDFNPAVVTTNIVDDSDEVTATLTATASTGEDGGSITYTVTLSNATGLPVMGHNGVSFTLDKGQIVNIAAGAASGSVTEAVNQDDVYKETDQRANAIVGKSGDAEFENLVFNQAVVTTQIVDDLDVVTATLTASGTLAANGAGTITYSVSLTGAPGSVAPTSDLTFKLTNGEVVTITAGQLSGLVNRTYGAGEVAGPVTNSINSVTAGGAEYEGLQSTGSTLVTPPPPPADLVTATLQASASTSEDGGSITYTVTLSRASGVPVTGHDGVSFSLANGETVNIAAGAVSGSITREVSRDDVYKEADSISNAIVGKSGDAEFVNLQFNPAATVTTAILDDVDAVTATLSANTGTIPSTGGTVIYTVSLTGAPGAVAPKSDLVFTLASGDQVKIFAGQLTASVSRTYGEGEVLGSVTNKINSITLGGTEYESLLSAGTTTVTVEGTSPTLAFGNVAGDETDGLVLATGSVAANWGSHGVGTLTLSATGATWDSGTQTLAADDKSWTLTLNAGGKTYDFKQLAAFKHSDTSNPDDALVIPVVGSAKAADGTLVSSSGFTVTVEDDGPSLTVTLAQDPAPVRLLVDETHLGTTASGNFAASFNVASAYGADGPGKLISSYGLGVKNFGVTGLFDTATGDPVVLAVQGAGVVFGRVGDASGAIVFTASVDADGIVTLEQMRAIKHSDASNPDDIKALLAADLITLTRYVYISDGDGDHEAHSVTLNIGGAFGFKDDGPSITVGLVDDALITLTTQDAETIAAASDTATADFSGVFLAAVTPSYGADGPGAVSLKGYALTVDDAASGLLSNGLAVTLVKVGSEVVGSTAAGEVFRLSVDATGKVTLTQAAEVDHVGPGNDLQIALAAGKVSLGVVATVTDGDGDSAAKNISADLGGNIRFDDDVPTITLAVSPALLDTLVVDESDLSANATANFAKNFSSLSAFGADGAGSIISSYSLGFKPDAGTSVVDNASGKDVVLVRNEVGMIEGRAGDEAGDLVFTVAVAANGDVTLDQIRAIRHSDVNKSNEATGLKSADLVTLTRTDTIIDGDGDSVSRSAKLNIGGALSFRDDGPRFTMVNDGNDEDTVAGVRTDVFAGTFNKINLVDWTFGADHAKSTVTLDKTVTTSPSGTAQIIATSSDGMSVVIEIRDITKNVVAELTLNADGNDVLNVIAPITISSPPVDITFAVKLTDGDGDTALQSIRVQLDKSNVVGVVTVEAIEGGLGNDVLQGSKDHDVLIAYDGNDMLMGLGGSDLLIGGAGSDTFVWKLNETGSDTIKDFTLDAVPSGGDVLDLKDLLVGESADAGSLANFLHFGANEFGQTEITVDVNGAAAGGLGQTITLSSVSYHQLQLWAGGTHDADIIGKLLTEHKLKVDGS